MPDISALGLAECRRTPPTSPTRPMATARWKGRVSTAKPAVVSIREESAQPNGRTDARDSIEMIQQRASEHADSIHGGLVCGSSQHRDTCVDHGRSDPAGAKPRPRKHRTTLSASGDGDDHYGIDIDDGAHFRGSD